MTMGLDLKSLENLRIFNGYETEKRERRLSFEAPSSPDDNTAESDTGQPDVQSLKGKARGKSKCGRPANPIPRHKRDSHIKAEYKRRDKIQKGFDTLLTLVPELRGVSEKESKAKMLFKSADYCRRLKSECGSTQTELTALRQELENLGTEIQDLQDKLPQQGITTVKKTEDLHMDTLYNQYVEEQTQKNWKFWIFGYFMRPLYDSFKQVTSEKDERQAFNSSVFEWVQNNLSLASLRKGVLDALRKISRHTSIMTHPEQLPLEARSKVTDHCVHVNTEIPAILTPPDTPRVPTPASANVTPIQTPTPTPPRTPLVSRRSSKREIQRSTESRSRSNSPASEETKPKRRSSYRSKSGRRNEECLEKMDFVTTVANPNLSLLGQLLTTPLSAKTSLLGAVTTETVSHTESRITPQQKKAIRTPESGHSMNTNERELLLQTYLQSVFSTAKKTPETPYTAAQTSDAFISAPVMTGLAGIDTWVQTSSLNANSSSEPMKVEVADSVASTGFIPLSSSGIISNGSLILTDNALSGFNASANQLEGAGISEFLPMELVTSVSNSSESTEFPSSSYAMSMQSAPELSISDLSCQTFGINSQVLNQDEDSMMNHLSLDVMDINNVLRFFTDDKHSSS